MNNLPTILIIDDEPEIRKFLKASLGQNGFKTIEAISGNEGIKFLTSHPPELVILDLGLPDMEGLEVLKKLREWSSIPVIVLSARGQEKDKVEALELGADDYLTKPFGTAELLARIKVALRHAVQKKDSSDPMYKYQDLKVDFAKRLVTVKGEEVRLTPTEYKLLALLAKHAGKVLTHSSLVKDIWGKTLQENNHYLRIHVQHIRKKIGDDPLKPRYIITEPGIGYRLKG